MLNRKSVTWQLLFLLLFVLSGCAGNRRKEVKIAPTEAGGQARAEASSSSSEKQEQERQAQNREKAVRKLIAEAQALFERGRGVLEEGKREQARALFREGLDKLRNSPFSSSEYPGIEETYRQMSAGIRAFEQQALAVPDEPEMPGPEMVPSTDSPLDEIADLNLYSLEVDPALESLVSEDLANTRFDIPMVINREVLKFLNYYQGRGRKLMEEGLKRSGMYLDLFRRVFEEEGVPLDLIYMAHVESLFKPTAYSRAKARGIWQFIEATARLYDLKIDWWQDERSDIYKSTQAAARHLKDLNAEFGDWYLSLAAYNTGAARISRNLERHGQMDYWAMSRRRLLPRETRNYVPSILASILIYRNPRTYGFQVEPMKPVQFDWFELDFQVDLRVVADSIGVPFSHLAELNPQLRRGVTPFETEGYALKVPSGKGMLLAQQLAQLPPEKRLRLRHHKVQKGETLSQIARRYHTPLQTIAETNRIRNINRLSLGQDLIIPISAGASGGDASSARRSASRNGQYTVQAGDSLYRIARTHGVSLSDLFRWNNLKPGEIIYPGDRIRVSDENASSGSAASGQ